MGIWDGQARLCFCARRCGAAEPKNIRRTCPARASIVSQLNQLPRIDSLTGGVNHFRSLPCGASVVIKLPFVIEGDVPHKRHVCSVD
jgi:hypothetical protein